MWQVFVVPLFEFTLPLYYYEESVSKKHTLDQILRGSFKSFTELRKRVNTCLIEDLMGYNLESRSKHIQYISEQKWEFRLQGKKYCPGLDNY